MASESEGYMASASLCTISASDQEEITAVAIGFFEAWNRHDMKAFAELFTGMHWRGKTAVVKAHEIFHRTIFQNTEMTLTDVGIRVATADVAVAIVTLKAETSQRPSRAKGGDSGPVIPHAREVRRRMEDHSWSQYGNRSFLREPETHDVQYVIKGVRNGPADAPEPAAL
jgi:uncharacterized protein (TIGR02246 family)